jgi:hypothetical protein
MVVRRIRNLQETITVSDIQDDILGAFAERAIMERNRVVKRYKPTRVTKWVGGREGADERSVKLGENIRYHFDYLKSIIIEAHKRLRDNSPVDVGTSADQYRYKDSHVIIADGAPYYDPTTLPDDITEVTITNVMPYARKVELRGWGKKGTIRFHAPYHTYEITASELKRYSNIVNIKFTYVDMPGFAAGKQGTKRQMAASIRYPALIISLR